MLNKQAAKRRITSIQSTRKITNAMRLISSTKLRKMRLLYDQTAEYTASIETIAGRIAQHLNEENVWLRPKKGLKDIVIVLFSDMGLCGGYNSNVLKLVKDRVSVDSELIVIGTKNRRALLDLGYSINPDIIYSDQIEAVDITRISNSLVSRFVLNEIGSVRIVYTKFINTMTFTPVIKNILPLEIEVQDNGEATSHQEIEYEPDEKTVLDYLVPQYVNALLYHLFYESKASEQSARRIAMEKATDNADELIDILKLKYNQARQAMITQELTEIVAASDE